MKKQTLLSVSLLLLGSTLAWANKSETTSAMPKKPESATFTLMKKMVGTWDVEDTKDKNKFKIVYSMASSDRCIKETMDMGNHSMDTLYCDNGDSVIATHYCAAGNQPRLKSMPLAANAKTVTFDFLDATGMSSPDEGHMHKLVMDMPGTDKVTAKWSFYEKGAEKNVSTFAMTRKK